MRVTDAQRFFTRSAESSTNTRIGGALGRLARPPSLFLGARQSEQCARWQTVKVLSHTCNSFGGPLGDARPAPRDKVDAKQTLVPADALVFND